MTVRRGRGRGRKEEDMRFLYVAGDGHVALIMESMHLECRVEREFWGHVVKIFLLPFIFIYLFFFFFFKFKIYLKI